MIKPLLAKLYGIILENKFSILIEIQGKIPKGKVYFRRHHSTIDHLITFKVIVEECNNNKIIFL